MRIVNNKIYIVKGETPTYSASVIDKDTGAPLIIDKGMVTNPQDKTTNTMIIEFVVREGAYYRDDDYKLKYNLRLGSDLLPLIVFDDSVIRQYEGTPTFTDGEWVWDNSWRPAVGDEKRLHRFVDNGDNFYCYFDSDTNTWKSYDFSFDVTFAYRDTSIMEPKTYKYEIALLGGVLKTSPSEKETIVNVVYKKPLLGLTDFIVEGSISE